MATRVDAVMFKPSSRLAWITVGVTYFLMIWGNLVSATGSGLGCPDWPLCHGTVFPPLQFAVVFEWGHRLIAAAAATLMITLVIQIRRSPQVSLTLKRSAAFLLIALGAQILLGGLTVWVGLSLTLSTIHLVLANLVFGTLLMMALALSHGKATLVSEDASLRRLTVSGLSVLLGQLALGALLRHDHAGLACPFFPTCLAGFLPIPFNFQTGIAFTHRWLGVLLLGVFVHLAIAAKRKCPPLARTAQITLGLALLQVVLGIYTVLTLLNTPLKALHASLGYALWGVLFYLSVRVGAFRSLWEDRPTS